MRKMSKKERKEIESEIMNIMAGATSFTYVRDILESQAEDDECTFMEAVIDDVMCASAWEDEGYYTDDDICLAIGRVFIDRLGILY